MVNFHNDWGIDLGNIFLKVPLGKSKISWFIIDKAIDYNVGPPQ